MERRFSLPRHVHHIVSRGREYFYSQEGRGAAHEGERKKLPDNPQTPEFWHAVRQAPGVSGPTPTDTVGALIDAYVCAWPMLQRPISKGTQDQYRRYLQPIRQAWGDLSAQSLRPKHVDQLILKIGAEKPGAANNTLDALKAMCRWAIGPVELLAHDPTQGLHRFAKGEEMATWERRPGPFLLQEEGKSTGKPFTENQNVEGVQPQTRRVPAP